MMAERQTSDTVLMVRPAAFGFHPEAAASNAFASTAMFDSTTVAREFDGLVAALTRSGVQLLLLDDPPIPAKPDAIFPNNWISFHADGTIVLYPMATERRRLERDRGAVEQLLTNAGFEVRRTVDLSRHELAGRFLEGTGSLILDRVRARAFASRSIRTDPEVVADFDRELGYSTILFDAFDRSGAPIYHTNVLLSLGGEFAILCSAAVPEEQREALRERLAVDRTLIEVDYGQMCSFACNILELEGSVGPVIAMSSAALASLRPEQQRQIERFGDIVHAAIPTIEAVGGGSVRCMIADVHLPRVSPAP